MDAAAQLKHSTLGQGVPAPPAHVISESAPASQTAAKPAKKPRERWTPEEHGRFLEGLKMYHRDWRSIESVFQYSWILPDGEFCAFVLLTVWA